MGYTPRDLARTHMRLTTLSVTLFPDFREGIYLFEDAYNILKLYAIYSFNLPYVI